MKKLAISFLLLMIFSSSQVNALSLMNYAGNTVHSITMDIYIDPLGDAQVTEVWKCTTKYNRIETIENSNPAREFVHEYAYDGRIKIEDFTVTDETGNQYESTYSSRYFDLRRSVQTKSYGLDGERSNVLTDFKNYSTIDENDYRRARALRWAISEEGEKIYTLKYKITDFVMQLEDAQVVSQVLIPLNLRPKPVGNVEITIYADEKFGENIETWVVGNTNYSLKIEDGKVKYNSVGTITEMECVDLLVKFPVDTFLIDRKTTTKYESLFNSFINKYAIHNIEEENTGEIEDVVESWKKHKDSVKIDMDDVIVAFMISSIVFVIGWRIIIFLKWLYSGSNDE